MKIAVAGAGYVGIANALLLAKNNEVVLLDIDCNKVDQINAGVSPIKDYEIEEALRIGEAKVHATMDPNKAFSNADFVLISTPTDYDLEEGNFDTSSIEDVLDKSMYFNKDSFIVIKSTVPVGYTEGLRTKYNNPNIIFSPEFLREGKALFDILNPSRIIIGDKTEKAKTFGSLLIEGAIRKDAPILYMNSTEAEAIKLFANTYLAMRIAFFNELDTFAELMDLDSSQIIQGVCLDPRIGDYYNNPSFGYGGYCLPKDTVQLLSMYNSIPQNIISAVVNANSVRKKHIVDTVVNKNPEIVGIYRLTMKKNSDNFRQSAIISIIDQLTIRGIEVIIYEPELNTEEFLNARVYKNLDKFKAASKLILANRITEELADSEDKVYTRDIFGRD